MRHYEGQNKNAAGDYERTLNYRWPWHVLLFLLTKYTSKTQFDKDLFEDVCLALMIFNIHTVLSFCSCFQHIFNICLLE